ncbi:MAG TPA: APC family permease, partial [Acidimicrobiia bacterium]
MASTDTTDTSAAGSTTTAPAPAAPQSLTARRPAIELPEPRSYRIKRRILGPALTTDQLEHERLGIPTAVAVFSSDCISSSAYATEQILTVLIGAIGIAAFSLVVPITFALIVVLMFLILSYRETIKAYPTAGGAYMVTRDNFGLLPAQVAGVALLTDYILTVAVSVSAGTAALVSLVPSLGAWSVLISVGFIAIIAGGNLKGVRESGLVFAIPTYFFIGMGALLLAVGFFKWFNGDLSMLHPGMAHGVWPAGSIKRKGGPGSGLLYGAALFVVLRAFASGGAAVTGVEAISNGVTAFRKPEWLNARKALFIMGGTLGTLFLGLSLLSTKVKPAVFASGTPTVISQIAQEVFGGRNALYGAMQIATLLILVLAANTSFADFPRLASFHAGDNFMPKQLTKRGHRLVFSNGIIALAACAAGLVIVTDAKVDRLIPLYAIGVFTSFTLSQAGMTKHHWTKREPSWRKGIVINGIGAVLSFVVDI